MAAPEPLYDLVLLLDTSAPEEQRKKVLTDVESAISGGGDDRQRARLGHAALAYEIRHRTDAEYHLLQFHGPATLLANLQRMLRIADGVVRFRIIKLAPGTPAPPELPRAEARGAAARRPPPRPHARPPRRAPAARQSRPRPPPRPRCAASAPPSRRLCNKSAEKAGSSPEIAPKPCLDSIADEFRDDCSLPKGATPMAASNINRVIITGNLTADPELRSLPSGTSLCKLRVACNTRRKDNSTNEWVDKPNYFDVTVWGAQGENCARYLSKGRPVAIDGRLEWREWESPEGQKRQAIDIIADTVQFLSSPRDDAGGGNGGGFTPRSDIPADTGDFAAAPAGGGCGAPGPGRRRHPVLGRGRPGSRAPPGARDASPLSRGATGRGSIARALAWRVGVSSAHAPGPARRAGDPMDKHYHHTLITALIETIASWTEADKDRLASMLGGHCYPGGPADRQEPGGDRAAAAVAPGGATPALLACSCPRGRCHICN